MIYIYDIYINQCFFRPTGRLGDWVVEFAASTSLLKRWERTRGGMRRANPDQES